MENPLVLLGRIQTQNILRATTQRQLPHSGALTSSIPIVRLPVPAAPLSPSLLPLPLAPER